MKNLGFFTVVIQTVDVFASSIYMPEPRKKIQKTENPTGITAN